jgi:hypothetical protein
MVEIKYKLQYCWSCDSEIMVKVTDLSSRNYCSACAWAKIGAVPYE